MLTKNSIDILDLFRKNPLLEISIYQLMKKLRKKSYQRVYEAVKLLEKRSILKSKKIGKASLISLPLTYQAIAQIAFLDEQEAINRNLPNHEKIISLKEISNYLIIVAGSYAKGLAKKSSDLDLVVIIPDNQKAMDAQKLVENLTFLFYPKAHLYVFNNRDFVEMLLDKKENYGKEIFRHHIILKNAYIYYELLKEAVENGFKG